MICRHLNIGKGMANREKNFCGKKKLLTLYPEICSSLER